MEVSVFSKKKEREEKELFQIFVQEAFNKSDPGPEEKICQDVYPPPCCSRGVHGCACDLLVDGNVSIQWETCGCESCRPLAYFCREHYVLKTLILCREGSHTHTPTHPHTLTHTHPHVQQVTCLFMLLGWFVFWGSLRAEGLWKEDVPFKKTNAGERVSMNVHQRPRHMSVHTCSRLRNSFLKMQHTPYFLN